MFLKKKTMIYTESCSQKRNKDNREKQAAQAGITEQIHGSEPSGNTAQIHDPEPSGNTAQIHGSEPSGNTAQIHGSARTDDNIEQIRSSAQINTINQTDSAAQIGFVKQCLLQPDQISQLKLAVEKADAVIIGAGAGLSTSAGFSYSGKRFVIYFSHWIEKYHFKDMYSAGFYPFPTLEEFWAYWSRYVYINRFQNPPKPVYEKLLSLIREKDYFVLTTNVDHCFQKAGFDKKRIFYTQGDYGLFQCSEPCHLKTYDNEDTIRRMVKAQGYVIDENGMLILPEGVTLKMTVTSELIPHCPKCGKPMSMNLRADHTFVEDEGWHKAAERYSEFLRRHRGINILFLELGVGANTPVIIKYPFWRYTQENPEAVYACVNFGQAYAPREIAERAICINGDISLILEKI